MSLFATLSSPNYSQVVYEFR
ncbi:hypothetical protein MICRO80W_830022 [Micrococcus luteus]|nr:hypothetical protein MICRO80W_830022 [Micrococcus luteus]